MRRTIVLPGWSACLTGRTGRQPAAGELMQSAKTDGIARRRAGPGRCARLVAGFCLLILSCHVWANGGRFEVRSATSGLRDDVYYLTARIDYRLSDKALEALESGVELTFELQIEVTRNRTLLPDDDIASLRQAYALSFQPLSERYVVKNVNSGDQESFATLFSALTAMGRVNELPIIDATLLEKRGRYDIRLRAVLDQNTLPGPLRLFSFWGNSFRLESKWYSWTLRE